MKLKNQSGQIYRPRILMRLFVIGMGLFLAGMHAIIFRDIDNPMQSPFLFLVLMLILAIDACFVWYGYIFTTQTYMTVNEDGIELRRGGSSLFTAWENISHFGIKGAGRNQLSGIYLYHKVQPVTDGFAERLFFGRETDFIPIGQVVNIPLHWGFFKRDIKLKQLAETDFGYDVQHYAPHLLNRFDEKPKSSANWLSSDKQDATYAVGAEAQQLRKHS